METIDRLILIFLSNNSPHWALQVLAGILLSVIVRDFFPILWKFTKNFKVSDPILGEWHTKHATFDKTGTLQLVNSKWLFKRSIDSDVIKVKTETDSGKVTLTGYTKRTSGNHCIYMQGKQKEEAYYNLSKIFPRDNSTVGIWSGVDYRNDMIAAPVFFSRLPISDLEFIETIQKHFDCELEKLVISHSPNTKRKLEKRHNE